MRVRELNVYHIRLPLRRPIQHASHRRTSTDNLLVSVELDDGTVGWGEGVPREYVTGETVEDGVARLTSANLAAQLPPCDSIADAIAVAEQLTLPRPADDDRQRVGNAARCALELAVLDAYGRAFGESFSTIAQKVTPSICYFRPRVQYSGVITSSRGFKLRALAFGMRWLGFGRVKLKVGIAGHDDLTRVRAARSRLGPRVRLRLDANEAWTADGAIEQLRSFTAFDIDCIEQPLPHARCDDLPRVRREGGVPVMLDESLCSLVDAERAADGGWCDRFNIRLSKVGGLLPALRIAEFAQRRGLSYQLGCQVGESCILSAAGRQFACAVNDLQAVEGSYDRHLLAANVGPNMTFGLGGWATLPLGGGHGAEVDGQRVESLVMGHWSLAGRSEREA